MSIESIKHHLIEKSKGFRPVLYMTFLSSVLASCTLPPTLAEVSYDITTRVGIVEDFANPNRPSSDFLFPNIPDFRTDQMLKEIEVPWTGYFEVECRAIQVIGPQKQPLQLGMSSDEGDVTYLHLQSGNGGFLLDKSKAQKVNRRQYHDVTKSIVIKVSDNIVDRSYDRNGPDSSTAITGTSKTVEAYKFKTGKNQVSCEFTTIEGNTYTDIAVVNIIDNRS
ncbi:MAG: hypothetical protein Q8P92_03675 [Candidatus Daviesbacteria bacterium]|nr:hypothetical protein [Candidatus Daviesbacteria bacterium]